jgi:hypothetical protein
MKGGAYMNWAESKYAVYSFGGVYFQFPEFTEDGEYG